MTRRQYAGAATPTVTVDAIASSGGGTVTIASSIGWPDGSIGKFHVVIDPGLSSEEKILMDFLSGNTLSFSPTGRGADSTLPTSHASGAQIWLCYTALDADEANAHINAVTFAAHPASAIEFTPTGTIISTTVQSAIAELDSETNTRVTALEAADPALDTRLDAIEANNWVTQARIDDAAVGTAELADANVTEVKLASNSVGTAKIIDANVTFAKLAAASVSRWTRAASTSILTASASIIIWTTEVEDDLSMLSAPATTITMPAGSDGLWGVDLSFTTDTSLTASGFFQLTKNTTYGYRIPNATLGAGDIGATWSVYLVAGDTIDFRVHNGANNTATLTAQSLKMARLAKVA